MNPYKSILVAVVIVAALIAVLTVAATPKPNTASYPIFQPALMKVY